MPIRIVLAAFVCLIYATAQRGPDVPAEIASGLQFARQGRYLDAERVLKAYAEQNPDRPEPQAILAQLYYHFGYYANALPAFDKLSHWHQSPARRRCRGHGRPRHAGLRRAYRGVSRTQHSQLLPLSCIIHLPALHVIGYPQVGQSSEALERLVA